MVPVADRHNAVPAMDHAERLCRALPEHGLTAASSTQVATDNTSSAGHGAIGCDEYTTGTNATAAGEPNCLRVRVADNPPARAVVEVISAAASVMRAQVLQAVARANATGSATTM